MRTVNSIFFKTSLIVALMAGLLAGLAGCKGDEPIAVYDAPKDPKLVSWAVPTDWVALSPMQLEYAAYSIPAGGEQPVRLSVSFLRADAPSATDLKANVDRWRKQLQLEPTTDSELAKLVKLDQRAEMVVQKVDMEGSDGNRIIAAIVPRADLLASQFGVWAVCIL